MQIEKFVCDIKIKDGKGMGEGQFEAEITNPRINRNGYRFNVNGIDLSNVKKGIPMTWSHDYLELPIGRVLEVWKEGRSLMGKFELDLITDFENVIYQKIKKGTINMVSMGSVAKKINDDQTIIEESEIIEVAVVTIGANDKSYITKNGLNLNKEEKGMYQEFLQRALTEKLGGLKEDSLKNHINSLKELTLALETSYEEATVDSKQVESTRKLVVLRQEAKLCDKQAELILQKINNKLKK